MFKYTTTEEGRQSLARDFSLCTYPKSEAEALSTMIVAQSVFTHATEFNYASPVFYNIMWPLNATCSVVPDGTTTLPFTRNALNLWFNASGNNTCINTTLENDLELMTIGAAFAYQTWTEVAFSTAGGSALFGPCADQYNEIAIASYCAKRFGAKLNCAQMGEKFPATTGNLTVVGIHRLALVNGWFDPTRGLSVQKPLESAPGISVINIARAGHCYDLNIPENQDTPGVLAARLQEAKLVKSWVAMYHKIGILIDWWEKLENLVKALVEPSPAPPSDGKKQQQQQQLLLLSILR